MTDRNGRQPDGAEKLVRDIRRATRRKFSAEEKIRIVLGETQQIAGIVDTLGSALERLSVVLAQERRQLEGLEVVGQQHLRRVAHDAAPTSRSM